MYQCITLGRSSSSAYTYLSYCNVQVNLDLYYLDVGEYLLQDSYNVNYEVERKKALNIILSQSRQQDREDAEVTLVLLCDSWLCFCILFMKRLLHVLLKPYLKSGKGWY